MRWPKLDAAIALTLALLLVIVASVAKLWHDTG